jgi:putative flippase GtrA
MRFLKFNAVGAVGIGVQLAVIWALTGALHVPVVAATAAGVAAALVHNYVWHRRWTWADRREIPPLAGFARFVLANGMVSLAGNVVIMAALAATTTLHPVAANLLAIAVCGVANYFVGDAVVFAGRT